MTAEAACHARRLCSAALRRLATEPRQPLDGTVINGLAERELNQRDLNGPQNHTQKGIAWEKKNIRELYHFLANFV